jgi:hypothetical protein
MQKLRLRLAVPLTAGQIRAARRLRNHVEAWKVNDATVRRLDERFPGFGYSAVLVKTVFVNTVYGTGIRDYRRVTDHLKKTLDKMDLRTAGPELVERLARVPKMRVKFWSFASKFAHLFVNSERFPIQDKYAEKSLEFHLGRANLNRRKSRYLAFVENLKRLRALAGVRCQTRELDHYLWLSEAYRIWRKGGKSRINREAMSLFERRSADLKYLPTSPRQQ